MPQSLYEPISYCSCNKYLFRTYWCRCICT